MPATSLAAIGLRSSPGARLDAPGDLRETIEACISNERVADNGSPDFRYDPSINQFTTFVTISNNAGINKTLSPLALSATISGVEGGYRAPSRPMIGLALRNE